MKFCEFMVYRGGASEASEATLTDYVAGARDRCIIRASSPQANYRIIGLISACAYQVY